MGDYRADAVRQTIASLKVHLGDRTDCKVEGGSSLRALGVASDRAAPEILIRKKRLGTADGFADVPAFVLNFKTPQSGDERHWAFVARCEEAGVDEWFSFACGLSPRGLVLQGGRWDGDGYEPLFGTDGRLSSRLGFDLIAGPDGVQIQDWTTRFPSLELREHIAALESRLRSAEGRLKRIEARRTEVIDKVASLQRRLADALLEAEEPHTFLAKAAGATDGNGA